MSFMKSRNSTRRRRFLWSGGLGAAVRQLQIALRPLQCLDALPSLRRVFRFSAAVARVVETRGPSFGIAHTPLRGRAGRASGRAANRRARHAAGREQYNPRALPQPVVFCLRRTRQAVKPGMLRHAQVNRGSLRDAVHASLNHAHSLMMVGIRCCH